jgi:putative ATP-binding cassette transporter
MEINRISDLFWKLSPNLFFLSVILGCVTGLCYALLIPFIIYAITLDTTVIFQLEINNYNFFNSPTSELGTLFLGICFGIILIKSISSILATYIASKASMLHRTNFYRRINALPYESLEKIGQARLINLLNIDIPALSNSASILALMWINIVTVVGILGYLISLNFNVFIFVLVCLIVAIVTYQVPILVGLYFNSKSRNHYDRVQQGVKGLIYGAKELKLSNRASTEYLEEELEQPENLTFKYRMKGLSTLTIAESYGEMIAFLVITVVIFQLPYVYRITAVELFGIVMALLYLTGPVGVILKAASDMQDGKIALSKINAFNKEIFEEQVSDNQQIIDSWKSLFFSKIGYQYSDSTDAFVLKNINFELKRGQITFIIGGNGSGKSTLSKLISQHYLPTQGNIHLGEHKIGIDNIGAARECISAIYSDFYVFDKLYCDVDKNQLNHCLELLHLADKVKVHDGRFNTTSLSDGQRKRLALLSLLIEDRPICLFDEWASDQDPIFKKIFYQNILPELRNQGKIVIVISHDDRYFDCADQIIRMEQGSIQEVIYQEALVS